MLATTDADRSGAAISALTRAVGAGAGAAAVTAALRRSIAVGALVPDRSGDAFVPRTPAPRVAVPPSWRPWTDRGYLPFRVKTAPLDPVVARALTAVFDLLNDAPELSCVPHWVAPDKVLSLYLPAAADLRPVAGGDPVADADRVHRACLRSLTRFVAWDAVLREGVARAGVDEPAMFPVAARYAAARATLAELIGDTGLPAALPGPVTGPSTLFCDPKPANFLVPAADRSRLGEPGAPEPVRIDLDLMAVQCPLSLQLVLVLFSHPIATGGQPAAAAFDRLRRSAHRAAEALRVDPAEVDVMLHYHLVRNLVAAMTGGPPSAAKASDMAAMLLAAWDQVPGLTVRRAAADRLRARAAEFREEAR